MADGQVATRRTEPATATAMTRVDVLRHTDTPDDGFRCREAPLGRLEDNPGYLPGRTDVQDTCTRLHYTHTPNSRNYPRDMNDYAVLIRPPGACPMRVSTSR